MNDQELLAKGLIELDISIADTAKHNLLEHMRILHKWNKAHSLTAIKDIQSMIKLHILDSLSINRHLQGQTMLDVGTGPGFPGLPLAIINPKQNYILLDSNEKKCQFIEYVKNELSLPNVSVVQSRLEKYVPSAQIDAVMSRATASVDWLCEQASSIVQPKGHMYFMLGQEINIPNDLNKVYRVERLRVPFVNASRNLLIIEN